MKRLCCYSLSLPPEGHADLATQLLTSVDSLRAHSPDVEVVVFAYDALPDGLGTALQGFGARVWPLEGYARRLSSLCPVGAESLAAYPPLHKLLNFREIASLQPDQVLMLDCDTYFRGPVERLFEAGRGSELVAREEVGSSRSHHGCLRTMIDEERLARIASAAGVRAAPPFNLGVVLLNDGLWIKLAGITPLIVHYAWRFMLWMALNPDDPADGFAEGVGVEALRRRWSTLMPAEQASALEYPSANRWILDEVTLWMSLGHLRDVRYADFARDDVIQSNEFEAPDGPSDWAVCHYFSRNMDRMVEFVRRGDREGI